MKTEFKYKVQKLIENYKKVTDAFIAKIKDWEEDILYSSDHRQDKIREIKAEMKANDADFNDQLQKIIAEEINAIKTSSIKQPADYQLQISNALNFIQMGKANITDDQAFEIVKPFIGDYQTMRNFRAIIVNTNFHVTTHILSILDLAVNKLEMLKQQTKEFFNAGSYITNGLGVAIANNTILYEAEEIESKLTKLDAYIPASFSEVKQEISSEINDKMAVTG